MIIRYVCVHNVSDKKTANILNYSLWPNTYWNELEMTNSSEDIYMEI